MKTVILGSGATFGTLASAPTTPGFGRALRARLAEQGKEWRREYPSLAAVVDDVRPEHAKPSSGWDLSNVWTRMDYFSKLPGLREGGDYGCAASFDVHAAVLEVYGVPVCNDVARLLASGRSFTLLDLVTGLKPGDVLVSFNWDVAVELIAAHLHVDLVQAPCALTRSSIQLVKPHGSVSWQHRWQQRRVDMRATPTPSTTPVMPHEVREFVQPFVIGAVPVKSELIREIQGDGPLTPYTVLIEQWRTFREALRTADEVVIAGYSFPGDDSYGRFLIQEAVGRRAKRLRRVSFYDLKPERAAMGVKLKSIFKVRTPVWLGPVVVRAPSRRSTTRRSRR